MYPSPPDAAAVTISRSRTWLFIIVLAIALPARAAGVTVRIDGVEGDMRKAIAAALQLSQYSGREVTDAQLRRLVGAAEGEARSALEAFGYYHATVDARIVAEPGAPRVELHIVPGEPVRVASVDIVLGGAADGQKAVRKAIAAFAPARGRIFDQPTYEKSKAAIGSALHASGYLDAKLVTHRVDVTRADNTARIHLAWDVGPRYRFGATRFTGAQFPDTLLDRYIPWRDGDFYSQDKLLELQQRLIDADYFAIVQVTPALDALASGTVPVHVALTPAKRTLYTAGLFVGTDTGFGVRAGMKRRWVNRRGHKLGLETVLAERLRTVTATWSIPLPGPDNHSVNFGAGFRDEATDTSTSRTSRLAANDSRLWNGWVRTLGLQYIGGNFEVADEHHTTSLLFPEASLTRKRADDPAFPRNGYSVAVTVRGTPGGLVSDTWFAQATADAKWIRSVGERGRFLARGSLGAGETGDFDRLPPELRFFAGGDRSIRGYAFQTIGPVNDLGKVIGGNDLAVASAEYEYYFRPDWGIATFVDAGDAFSGFGDFDLKVGAGFGVRWRSPVGLVRADLGFPVHDRVHHGVELHIVIGPDL